MSVSTSRSCEENLYENPFYILAVFFLPFHTLFKGIHREGVINL